MIMKHTLYGDGIHDDYPAIQEMIDSGVCEVSLPVPQKHYLISKTLVLPSDFRLVLTYAEIKLAGGFLLTEYPILRLKILFLIITWVIHMQLIWIVFI